jgi:hypothetical protein
MRFVSIKMTEYCGFHTESKQTSETLTTLFFAYFLNEAVILLLADANLTFYKLLRLVPIIRLGPFPDLIDNWYINIAPSMLKTMIIKSSFDYTLILMQFGVKIINRARD